MDFGTCRGTVASGGGEEELEGCGCSEDCESFRCCWAPC